MVKSRGLIKALAFLTIAVIAIDIVWISATSFSFAMMSAVPSLAFTALLGGLGIFYTIKRPRPLLQNILFSTVFLLTLTNALAIFSYLIAGLNLPSQDANLARIDQVLGFDFFSFLAFFNTHHILGNLLTQAYNTSLIQVMALVLILGFANRRDRLIEFFAAYAFTLTITIIISAVLPAAGTFAYFKPAPELFQNLNPASGIAHVEHFNAVRDGSLRHLSLLNVHGLVSFPSFHTALAVLTILIFRGMGPLFAGAAILNAAVILSTLTEGGHYLVDVIAGAMLALAVFAAVRAYLNGFSSLSHKPSSASEPVPVS